jgi:transposase
MDYYVGINVSLEPSSVCVLNAAGQVVREAKAASEPEALIIFLTRLGLPLTRIGLEVGPLSQWLSAGLAKPGFDVVLLETRHLKAALSLYHKPPFLLHLPGSLPRRPGRATESRCSGTGPGLGFW